MMSLQSALKAAVLAAGFAIAGGAQAATVYCPNGVGGALTAPTSGRYVEITNAANPGYCFYQDKNLQNDDIAALGLTIVDKNGSEGLAPGALVGSGFPNDSTSGTWEISSPSVWDGDFKLYLAFHFGNGGGSPDSFVVQLQDGAMSGDWKFLAVSPQTVNGLSNYYLLRAPGGFVPPDEIPEPASVALFGVGLVAVAAMRRRRKG